MRFFKIFHTFIRPFVSEMLYLHQTFTNYMTDWCIHFGISGYQMWLQVMGRLLILLRYCEFSHINNNHSYLKYCMFTKFLPNLCLINAYNKSDKTASYGTFICNWIFKYYYYIGFKHHLKRNSFIKLSKIMRWKVILFKHLWLHQFCL